THEANSRGQLTRPTHGAQLTGPNSRGPAIGPTRESTPRVQRLTALTPGTHITCNVHPHKVASLRSPTPKSPTPEKSNVDTDDGPVRAASAEVTRSGCSLEGVRWRATTPAGHDDRAGGCAVDA